jgi:hypothetical protein
MPLCFVTVCIKAYRIIWAHPSIFSLFAKTGLLKVSGTTLNGPCRATMLKALPLFTQAKKRTHLDQITFGPDHSCIMARP